MQRGHKRQHVGHARVVASGAHPAAYVQHQRQVEAGKEGQKAPGRFGPHQPRHFVAQRVGVARLAAQQQVQGAAGRGAGAVLGMQRQANEGAGGVGPAAPARMRQPAIAAHEAIDAGGFAGGPGAVGQALGQQPRVGALGARVGGVAARGQRPQREGGLQRHHRVAFMGRQFAVAVEEGLLRAQRPRAIGPLLVEQVLSAARHRRQRGVKAQVAEPHQRQGGGMDAAGAACTAAGRLFVGPPRAVAVLPGQQVGHQRVGQALGRQLGQLRIVGGPAEEVA